MGKAYAIIFTAAAIAAFYYLGQFGGHVPSSVEAFCARTPDPEICGRIQP